VFRVSPSISITDKAGCGLRRPPEVADAVTLFRTVGPPEEEWLLFAADDDAGWMSLRSEPKQAPILSTTTSRARFGKRRPLRGGEGTGVVKCVALLPIACSECSNGAVLKWSGKTTVDSTFPKLPHLIRVCVCIKHSPGWASDQHSNPKRLTN
jgi:hypothetical protein